MGRFVAASPTEVPSKVTTPSWKGSRPLITLIKVLFPEPDGPQITTTSPLSTLVEQLTKTWKLPYHLETTSIWIMPTPGDDSTEGVVFSVSGIG